MTYGLTATGFRRKLYSEIIADMSAWLRARVSENLDLSEETVLGNWDAIVADHLEELWELVEAACNATDPDQAVEALLVGLCKLSGVIREGPKQGSVVLQCTFSKAATIAAGGLTVAVAGQSSNTWTNDEEIVATGAGWQLVDFSSVAASSAAVALAGTLTVIQTPHDGLSAVTNPADAIPGADLQSLDSLRTERENSLAASGKATVPAITADLQAVEGVLDVDVRENVYDYTVNAIPPHAIQATIWDGATPQAADQDVADALYAAKGAGRPTVGAIESTVTDPFGDDQLVYWNRVEQVELSVAVTVVGSTTANAVKAAIIAGYTEEVGEDVIRSQLIAAALSTVGVTDVSALTIGIHPTYSPTNYTIGALQIGLLDSARIYVTIT